MDGKNTLMLNQMTMRKAVAHWLNNEIMQDNVTVESVIAREGTFEIIFAEKVDGNASQNRTH